MSPHYLLTVIRLERLDWDRLLYSKAPDLYVKIRRDGDLGKTRVIKRNSSPVWNEEFVIPPSDEPSELTIELKHNAMFRKTLVGSVHINISDLEAKCSDGEAPLELLSSDGMSAGSIVVHLAAIDAPEAVNISVEVAQGDVQRSGLARSTKGSDAIQWIDDKLSGLSNQGDFYRAVGELLSRLEVFRQVIDLASNIHPFVTMAWTVASGLCQLVDRTFKVDKKLVHLVSTMVDAFSSIRDIQSLQSRFSSLQGPITGLMKQSVEGCIFVRHYSGCSFARRMLDTTSSDKIDKFEQSLASYKEQIDCRVICETAVVSIRVVGRVETMYLSERLNPSAFDAFDRPVCLPETRLEIRQHIIEWMFSETSQNIFWLCGVAGSGKSTVAETIVGHSREISRLGAFLFFTREKSEPASVIRTIAYQLALFDSSICESMLSRIDSDKNIGTASSTQQFSKLLLEPLRSAEASTPGPVIVVLDALDECGTPESRSQLMKLLKEFAHLPKSIRFLITSRREADIDILLSSQPGHILATELDHTSATSQDDVLSFLRAEMRDALEGWVEIPENWPWDENMKVLGRAANGLFIWASTAVKMVRVSDDPLFQLESLVADSRSVSGFGLNELYGAALRKSGIAWDNERSRGRFREVLSLVLLSRVPLSSEEIDGILGFSPRQSSLLVLSRLRSLVTYAPGGSVSLLHASFSDYLTLSDRADDPWFIDIHPAQQMIVKRCLAIMKTELRYNICNLESSCVRNDDVPDLADRIKSKISPQLEHACLHWAHHLTEIPCSSELLDAVTDFAYNRLLFWFEVLSLVKMFGRVSSQALSGASRWCELHDSGIASFLEDAYKLAYMFSSPIMDSTPHIYVSMIPLPGGDSEVAAHYSKCMSSMVRIHRMGVRSPPLCLKLLGGHSETVLSVAFAPDGKQIASAAEDDTVKVWDIDNGEVMFALKGRVVCFSPEGDCIATGSKDGALRVWDAKNGQLVSGPLEGHRDWITSVAWSPDGTMIASGSDDENVIVRGGDGKVTFALKGQSSRITSVAFSPDSTRLASGSDSGAIRVWDVRTGKPAFGPFDVQSRVSPVAFSPTGMHLVSGGDETKIWEMESGNPISTWEGHTTSVAYTPCGTRVVCASGKTIKVRDVESRNLVCSLEGHTDWVYSVSVSLDGKYIASGSGDNTTRIWNATATSVSKPSAKHAGAVTSVAFSPDDRRIASTSFDGSIIVWDAETGNAALGPLIGHRNSVNCVAFTPDGSRLLSGSDDKTIRIWDAETGECVTDPLRHEYGVYCIAVSPDGRTVASGFYGSASVWSIATGQLIAGALRGHSGRVNAVAFSPDGKRLASGSFNGKIIIWNTTDWQATSHLVTGLTSNVYTVCFSPEGTQVASGSDDGTIVIQDTESGQIVAGPFSGHPWTVQSIVYSPDGKHVIAGSWDNTICVWNVESGKTVCKLEGHSSGVYSLSLSSHGFHAVSGSLDGTIRVWDVSDILQPPESMSFANATSSEWILDTDGWILGGQDQRDLLLWIPPDLRHFLLRPRNLAVMSCDFSTKLDFTDAAIGAHWAECFVGPENTI